MRASMYITTKAALYPFALEHHSTANKRTTTHTKLQHKHSIPSTARMAPNNKMATPVCIYNKESLSQVWLVTSRLALLPLQFILHIPSLKGTTLHQLWKKHIPKEGRGMQFELQCKGNLHQCKVALHHSLSGTFCCERECKKEQHRHRNAGARRLAKSAILLARRVFHSANFEEILTPSHNFGKIQRGGYTPQ